jgi:hypothetical protein
VILCAIEVYLYENGIVIDEWITGSITLPEFEALTIIVSLLVGVMFAMVVSK